MVGVSNLNRKMCKFIWEQTCRKNNIIEMAIGSQDIPRRQDNSWIKYPPWSGSQETERDYKQGGMKY